MYNVVTFLPNRCVDLNDTMLFTMLLRCSNIANLVVVLFTQGAKLNTLHLSLLFNPLPPSVLI